MAHGEKYGEQMDNVLDPVDQAMFEFGRATGVDVLIQCAWVYDRAIDLDGVRRFHDQLQRGRLSRAIERSPLPFGRHRWVSPSGSSELEIVAAARPREDVDNWLNEQANTIQLDPEHGPQWHLAVLPFTGGGAGVSLLVPHCLADGIGVAEAAADAALGREDPVSWPAAGSRRRSHAVREDARQSGRDIRPMGRAVAAVARSARQSGADAAQRPTTPPQPFAGADKPIAVPSATMLIDAEEWEARAQSLGGTSNSLLVGLTARLAERRGRVTADGSVTLRIPRNDRQPGDTRGNAVSAVDTIIDPAPAASDLRGIRTAIKQALIRHRELPDHERALMSLVPLVPKRMLKKITGNGTGVVSTHLGAVNPAATRPDGTEADQFVMKMHYAGVTEEIMHRFGGLQIVASGSANGQVFVMVHAYQPGRPNSNDDLRHDLSSVLKEFSLTGIHI
jgi:diacylglycerol O-acyltransferase / wax synthase